MALLKEKKVLGGQAVGSYWKIVEVHVDVLNLTCAMDLNLYKDKESADAKAPPLEQKHIVLPIAKEDLSDDLRAWAYGGIKAYAAQEVVVGKDDKGEEIKEPKDADLSGAVDS